MATYQVADRGDLRKYRTEIPNSVDDMGLSVYAFRLYAHLKRVAGDSGTCYQATSTIAKACKMSMGMVSRAKIELANKGLIMVTIKKGEHGEFDSHLIEIVDIWSENYAKYSTCSRGEQDRSPDDTDPFTPEDRTVSPGETKKEPLNTGKNPVKNEQGNGRRKPAPDPAKAKRNAEVEQIAKTLAAITGMDFGKNAGQLKKEAVKFTIDDLPRLQADYTPPTGAWYLYDWRGQKGERPGLYLIRQTWGNLKPSPNGNGAKPTVQDERKAGLQRARERYGINGDTK